MSRIAVDVYYSIELFKPPYEIDQWLEALASEFGGRLLIDAIAGSSRNLFYQFSDCQGAKHFIELCHQRNQVRAEIWHPGTLSRMRQEGLC